MVVKSVFTVIAVYKTKINYSKLAHKNFSKTLDTKGGNQFFKIEVGEKGGRTKIFLKS